MHARVARYDIPLDRMEDAVEAFREAGTQLQQLEGMIGGYLLVEHESGTALTFTLWEERRALAASETRAALLRQRAVRAAGGSVAAVGEYEVALEFGGYTRELRRESEGG